MDFLQVLGVLDSKQIDILIYILENTEAANNTFIGTYTKIQAEVGVSRPTVATVMKKLQDNNFIKRVQNGVWQVSANILMKGSEHKKSLLLNYFNDQQQEPQLDGQMTTEEL
jgi:DNA-binding Lrp family transcriptional regulator